MGRSFIVVAGWALLAGCLGAAARAADAAPPGDITLSGAFRRSNEKDQTHELKGVFTPAGQDEWKVVFTCQWKGKDQTFKGSLKGNLKDGEVTGSCAIAGGKRTWSVKGTAKAGVVTCKHYETTKGADSYSGDFTIR